MIVQEIEVRAGIRQRLKLDGVEIEIRTFTNKRDSSWYMDIFGSDRTLYSAAVPLVVGLDLFYNLRHKSIPPGYLYVLTRLPEDPGLDSFDNKTHSLVYASP